MRKFTIDLEKMSSFIFMIFLLVFEISNGIMCNEFWMKVYSLLSIRYYRTFNKNFLNRLYVPKKKLIIILPFLGTISSNLKRKLQTSIRNSWHTIPFGSWNTKRNFKKGQLSVRYYGTFNKNIFVSFTGISPSDAFLLDPRCFLFFVYNTHFLLCWALAQFHQGVL